jgi:hypothetical protein
VDSSLGKKEGPFGTAGTYSAGGQITLVFSRA